MQAPQIEQLFTRVDGSYFFARWGRPIVPIVFGVEDATLSIIKGAIEAVVTLAGHKMAETDPELGANLMVFFFREWDELRHVPGLDRMLPDLPGLLSRLETGAANQYRAFRFDPSGAIRACFVFLRMDEELSAVPAETLALSQAVQAILLWAEAAFDAHPPLARSADDPTAPVFLRPEIAGIIRAAYDPVLPAHTRDSSHALRLAARITAAAQTN